MQPLLGLGFSLIMLISTMLLSSCDPEREHVVEWTFHNQLEREVDLHLYIDSSVLTNKVSNFVSIPPGDSAVLYTSRITDTGAVGAGYFYTEVDSVMVK